MTDRDVDDLIAAAPLTAEDEAKFRKSVAVIDRVERENENEGTPQWSNHVVRRLLATIDEARATAVPDNANQTELTTPVVRPEDGLDVERLAKALGAGDLEWRGYLVEAERVAAEYVRLAADQEEGG